MSRALWSFLLFGSIVFASVISGSWLFREMQGPVVIPGWGLFGGVLIGVAVYGGVELAIAGNKLGRWIVLAGGLMEVFASYMLFDGAGHSFLLAGVLAICPTAIAIMAGMVRASATQLARAEQASSEQQAFELEEQRKEREHQRKLAAEEAAFQRQLAMQELQTKQQAEARRDELAAQRAIEQAKAAAEARKAEAQAKVELARAEQEQARQLAQASSAASEASTSQAQASKELLPCPNTEWGCDYRGSKMGVAGHQAHCKFKPELAAAGNGHHKEAL